MDDKDRRALAGHRVIIDMEAFQGRGPVLIGDGFFHQRGMGTGDEGGGKEQSAE